MGDAVINYEVLVKTMGRKMKHSPGLRIVFAVIVGLLLVGAVCRPGPEIDGSGSIKLLIMDTAITYVQGIRYF